jgi:hypothetical protein
MTTFSQEDRLDKLPPLSEQYAIDDLLTEHFGFAPKVFTGKSSRTTPPRRERTTR